jgi:hypothetical protein
VHAIRMKVSLRANGNSGFVTEYAPTIEIAYQLKHCRVAGYLFHFAKCLPRVLHAQAVHGSLAPAFPNRNSFLDFS